MPPVPRGRPEVFRPNRVVGSPQGDDVIANGGWVLRVGTRLSETASQIERDFRPGETGRAPEGVHVRGRRPSPGEAATAHSPFARCRALMGSRRSPLSSGEGCTVFERTFARPQLTPRARAALRRETLPRGTNRLPPAHFSRSVPLADWANCQARSSSAVLVGIRIWHIS
jgi:hypothetical protein